MRPIFGVSASSFAATVVTQQNAIDNKDSYPLAAQAVSDSFLVDDGFTGADSEKNAIILQEQLQEVFFSWRVCTYRVLSVLRHLSHELLASQSVHEITGANSFTKVLDVEWNATLDAFRPVISSCKSVKTLTKG